MKRTFLATGLLATACLIGPGLSAAKAASRIEKTLKLEQGGRFRLDTSVGRVRVTGKSGSGAHIVVTARRGDLDELLSIRFEEGAGTVTVTVRWRDALSWFEQMRNSFDFDIEVPEKTATEIRTSGGSISVAGIHSRAKLETSGGSIDVRSLTGDLEADTSGGSIHLNDIKGRSRVQTSGGGIQAANLEGTLHAESSGGSIDLDRIRDDIDAHTSGGGITIKNAGGRVRADTSGGSIEASFAPGNARGGTLETSGGGITVAVDPRVGLAIDAEGNSVKANLPIRAAGEVSPRRLHGTLGSGGEGLRLRASGGSIRIEGL